MASSRITVSVDASRLQAFVDVTPGEPAGAEELEAALESAGVCEGLETAACDRLADGLARESFATKRSCVAIGRAAEDGEPSCVEFGDEEGLLGGTLRQDGTFDFRDRKLIKRVQENEVFAHYRAATAGLDGLGVDGHPLSAKPGEDRPPDLGPGAERADDGSIRALRDGVIFHDGLSIDVVDHFVHQGNVDLHSGDLDMEGSITVTGEIHRNATVRAKGDVLVQGCVDGGHVVAGGSAEIMRGLVGSESGSVSAGIDVKVAHVWNARVDAGGRIEIGTDCMNGRLHGSEVAIGGRVLGGEIRAERHIEVRQAGAAAGAGTVLAAAMPLPSGPATEGDPAAGGKGASAKPRKRGVLARKREQRRRIRALRPGAAIVVTGEAFPGVKIRIGNSRLAVEQSASNLRFEWDKERGVHVVEDSSAKEAAASD